MSSPGYAGRWRSYSAAISSKTLPSRRAADSGSGVIHRPPFMTGTVTVTSRAAGLQQLHLSAATRRPRLLDLDPAGRNTRSAPPSRSPDDVSTVRTYGEQRFY